MNGEHRLEIVLYIVGAFVGGTITGWAAGRGHWHETISGWAMLALISGAIIWQTRREPK